MGSDDDELDEFLAASDKLAQSLESSNKDATNIDTKPVEPALTEVQLKSLGNDAFSKGDNQKAIDYYTQGISINPENYVLWSNRSAAYLKLGRLDEALRDATECLRLNPVWGKAYGRKGASLYALGRYKEARDAYNEGLTVDKTNATLSQGKEKCEVALKSQPQSSTSAEQRDKERKEEEANDKDFEEFMQKVSKLDPNQVPKELKVTAIDHDAETAGWTPSNQLERILCHRYKWINLNPFTVFGMAHNATDEDIKKRYRKLSALVHPDKNSDDRAQDAFEQVKAAYEKLKDKDQRDVVIRTITKVTKKVVLTRNRLKKKGLSEVELVKRDGPLEEAIEKAIKMEFATQEHERIQSEKRRRNYENRERDKEEEKMNYWRNVKKTEETLREGREDRAKSWQSFAKRKRGKGSSNPEPKRGKQSAGVDEAYKSNWR